MSKDVTALHVDDRVVGMMVRIYAATRNEDGTEGRGRVMDNSYHRDERTALIACKGIDVMGTDGKVAERLALLVNDGRYFMFQNGGIPIEVSSSDEEVKLAADARAKALEKLSPSDRAALGL